MTSLHTIRTDVVGSLLRPDAILKGRKALDAGKINAAGMRAIEDREVNGCIAMQEGVGLDVVTDGEFRRLNFQESFASAVEGFDAGERSFEGYAKRLEGAAPLQRFEVRAQAKGQAIADRTAAISRLKLKHNVVLDEYKYASSVAKKPVKVTLIGPDRISQRFDYENSKGVYDGIDDFVADVVKIQREIIKSVTDAGCRYVHIDAPGYTAYVDEPSLKKMRDRGEDPDENFRRSLKADAAVVADFPGVTFGIHLCRGNQRSTWHREGTYDSIAERLFNELPHQRFLLEYDTERAGSFDPLRFMPKGKTAVLGLVSTKQPALETVDELKRRLDQASKFISLEQVAISPQCGFASNMIGNLITEDDQKRKLEVVVETARQVWGSQ